MAMSLSFYAVFSIFVFEQPDSKLIQIEGM